MNDKDKLDQTKKTTSIMTTSTIHSSNKHNNEQDEEDEQQDIDSDEETESVRIAIEQTKPIPLGKRQLFYVCRKRKYYKLRDILLDAITPKDTSTLSATTTSEVYSQGSKDQISF